MNVFMFDLRNLVDCLVRLSPPEIGASYFWFGIAPYHLVGSRIILAMVALHLAAAIWHTVVARDETVDRMVFPRRKRSAEDL
ncbi:hypothetical protein HFN63_31885 [Rhizobium leguminosarum]|nr:cytochrome b/b6 domain-containing protein [Rhizobium leguminosarum]MBY5774649.1 hypothetical protein [Rhizobium leguminosarum]